MTFALPLVVALFGACSFGGSTPSSADAGPDGSVADAGLDADVNTAPCGTPGAMRSNFDAGDERYFFRFRSGETVAPLSFDGELRFEADEFEDALADYGVKLGGRAITAEIIEPVQGNGSAQFFGTTSQLDRFGFSLTATTISGFIGATSGGLMPFDRLAHRHLRAREDSGVIVLETAGADGNFVQLFSSPFDASRPILAGFEVMPGAVGITSVVFDNLNATAEPAAWCAPSDFTDDFGDGLLDARWARIRTGRCTVLNESQGVANFDQLAGQEQTSCVNRAIAGFDLTKGPVSMHAPSISPPSGDSVLWRVFLEARAPGAVGFARVGYVDGETFTDGSGPNASGGELTSSRLYQDTSGGHDHFRINIPTPDRIQFEASPDGVTWTVLHEGPAPFDMRHVNLRIGTSSGYLANNKSFFIVDYN